MKSFSNIFFRRMVQYISCTFKKNYWCAKPPFTPVQNSISYRQIIWKKTPSIEPKPPLFFILVSEKKRGWTQKNINIQHNRTLDFRGLPNQDGMESE